jgi:transposase-like protein
LDSKVRAKARRGFPEKYKRPVGKSWRMDETYIKVKGDWKYLYRAVDKEGDSIDLLLTARRVPEGSVTFL